LVDEQNSANVVELATELTIAWLSNPNTRADAADVPGFLRSMHDAVRSLGDVAGSTANESAEREHVPAVTVRKSLASRDAIISLIDGKSYKTLKRHLANHGLSPVEYRQRYGLKADYPMVAPAYADQRREMAKKIGLGRKPKQPESGAEQKTSEKAPRRRATKQG
jgi:predicted transcriptional regulator